MIFNFYADPAHGWIKVPMKLIKELGIEDDISSFSYIRGDNVYLEEDSDLKKFQRAMWNAGRTVKFREHHTDRSSKIRSYARYGQN